jgi:hypothetical protein
MSLVHCWVHNGLPEVTYFESVKSSPHLQMLLFKIIFNTALPSNFSSSTCVCSGYTTISLYSIFICCILFWYPNNLILHRLINQVIFGQEYKLQSSLLRNFLFLLIQSKYSSQQPHMPLMWLLIFRTHKQIKLYFVYFHIQAKGQKILNRTTPRIHILQYEIRYTLISSDRIQVNSYMSENIHTDIQPPHSKATTRKQKVFDPKNTWQFSWEEIIILNCLHTVGVD